MAEYAIFAFKNGVASVRRQLYRKLYGYSAEGVKYPGLLSTCNGLKLGAGAIIVKAEHRKLIEELFTQLKVDFFTLSVDSHEMLLNGKNGNNGNNGDNFIPNGQ